MLRDSCRNRKRGRMLKSTPTFVSPELLTKLGVPANIRKLAKHAGAFSPADAKALALILFLLPEVGLKERRSAIERFALCATLLPCA